MRPLTTFSRLAAAVLVAAFSLVACGEDDGPSTTASTATAPPPAEQPNALWPSPEEARHTMTPGDVARSFAEDFIGVRRPALGEFQQGDSRSGEIAVMRRGENGHPTQRVIATIALRQLDGKRWFVIAAFSDEVEVTEPKLLEPVSSPVRIAGEGVGHEGNVVLRLHNAFDPEPLTQKAVIAGAIRREPFEAELTFGTPATAAGAIVARATQPLAGSDAFAAFPIGFAAR